METLHGINVPAANFTDKSNQSNRTAAATAENVENAGNVENANDVEDEHVQHDGANTAQAKQTGEPADSKTASGVPQPILVRQPRPELGSRQVGVHHYFSRNQIVSRAEQYVLTHDDVDRSSSTERCDGRQRHPIFMGLHTDVRTPESGAIFESNQIVGQQSTPFMGQRQHLDFAQSRPQSNINSQATRQTNDNPRLPHNSQPSRPRTRPMFDFGVLGGLPPRRGVQILSTNAHDRDDPRQEVFSNNTQGLYVRRNQLGHRIENWAPGSGRPPVCRRRAPQYNRSTAADETMQDGTDDRQPNIFQEISVDDDSPQIRFHRPQHEMRNCSPPVGNDTRRLAADGDPSTHVEAQDQQGSNFVDNCRLPEQRSQIEHLTEERCVPSSSPIETTDLPRYLTRILEGRHRGAVRGQRSAPLRGVDSHCPMVTTVHLRRVLEEIAPRYSGKISEIIAEINKLGKTTMAGANTTEALGHRQTSISRKTLRQMIKAGVVKKCTEPREINAICFLVPEPAKNRNRIICWPLWANQQASYEWDHSISHQDDIVDVMQKVVEAPYGATCDVKASFYQIEVEEPGTRIFVFEHAGEAYEFVRLPMGYTASAELMQVLCQGIAEKATTGLDVRYLVHVDNILYYGEETVVNEALAKTKQIAIDWRVVFGEISNEASQTVLFHGIHIDFHEKKIAMSEKATSKFTRFEEFLDSTSKTTQEPYLHMRILDGVAPLLKIISTGTFWSRAMHMGSRFTSGSMAPRFAVMQLCRAIARKAANNVDTFAMHRGALANLRSWLKSIPRHVNVPLRRSTDPHIVITTDASVTGGGYHVNIASDVIRQAFPWREEIPSAKIGKYELRTIAICIANLPRQLHSTPVHLFTDSTTAIGALQKGYSASRDINDEVGRIFSLCAQKNVWIEEVSYVNTKTNIADTLSRAITSSNVYIAQNLQLCWEWESTHYGFIQEGDLLLSIVCLGERHRRLP